MIRRVAAVLLAANLAFWGWTHWLRDQRPGLPEPAPAPSVAASQKGTEPSTVQSGATSAPAVVDDLLQDCIRLTGFPSQALLEAAAVRLAGGNLMIATSTATSNEGAAEGAGQVEGHWVHVAGLRDANAQRELIDRLRSAGLSDAYAMPDDAEHRVSVGLFSDAARARQRVEQLRALGIESTILPRSRGSTAQRWLELRGTLPADITAQVIKDWGLEPSQVSLSPCQP
jgi:hypothetical protein